MEVNAIIHENPASFIQIRSHAEGLPACLLFAHVLGFLSCDRLERRRLDGSLEVLLEEDACSVSSTCDDRSLRRSGSLSPGPPMRGRSARGQSTDDSIV